MAPVAFVFFLLSAGWIARSAARRSRTGAVLVGVLVFSAFVIGSGHLLSSWHRFGDSLAWAAVASACLLLTAGFSWRGRKKWLTPSRFDALPKFNFRFNTDVPGGFYPLAAAVGITGLTYLAVVLWVAPGNPDSLAAHCARVAFYLQNNSLSPYANNFWAQVTHGQNSPILMAFFFLSAGRGEGAMALVQYGAYWVAGAGVYGIARAAGLGRPAALVSTSLFLSLTICLLEATTPQNDLLVAAFLSAAAYFLLEFRTDRRRSTLRWAALAACLGLGTKVTFALALPSLAALAGVAALGLSRQEIARAAATLALAGMAAGAVVTLPGAYLDNLRRYGNPVGSPEVRRFHSFEGHARGEALRSGALNVAAFSVDFLTLDGLPPVSSVRQAQRVLRQAASRVLGALGIDPAQGLFIGSPFSYGREVVAHEDLSNWGLLGFTLLWPCVLLAIAGVGCPGRATRGLALGVVLFLFAQAFAGPYDPHRGRYFITAGVLAAPVAGHYLERGRRFLRGYFFVLALLQTVAVLGMLVWRERMPVLVVPGWTPMPAAESAAAPTARSIFRWTRAEQLTRDQTKLLEPLRRFETLVAPTARVHVRVNNTIYDYIFFGRGLTRQLTAGAFQDDDPSATTPRAEWLLFDQRPPDEYLARSEDTSLGQGLFLRRLTPTPELLTVRLPAGEGVRAAGCQPLAPWPIERFDGCPLFWLGHGQAQGLAFSVWSDRPRTVALTFDVAAGPGRPDAARRLLLHQGQDGPVVGVISFAGRAASSPAAEPGAPVTLQSGMNEFTLECLDEVAGNPGAGVSGEGRALLVVLHAVNVRLTGPVDCSPVETSQERHPPGAKSLSE